MTAGKIIHGRFGAQPVDLAPIEAEVVKGVAMRPGLYQIKQALPPGALAAIRKAFDPRARCTDCNGVATRENGLCNRCRRHRQELAP